MLLESELNIKITKQTAGTFCIHIQKALRNESFSLDNRDYTHFRFPLQILSLYDT